MLNPKILNPKSVSLNPKSVSLKLKTLNPKYGYELL